MPPKKVYESDPIYRRTRFDSFGATQISGSTKMCTKVDPTVYIRTILDSLEVFKVPLGKWVDQLKRQISKNQGKSDELF